MDVLGQYPPALWLAACAVAALSGFVKGMVGFAMPLILISGLSSFTEPDLALAGLILPTLVSNVVQALRGGIGAALAAVGQFRWFLATLAGFLVLGALLVPLVPRWAFLLLLGVPITAFAFSQLVGWTMTPRAQSRRLDLGFGGVAGIFGGMSGVWGPPTVMYLTVLDTPRSVSVQVQGVIYLLGSVILLAAHVASGVLTVRTGAFSGVLVVPAMAGMMLGFGLHDRIDQQTFRRATLLVLFLAGLNLIRRGIMV
jgi:uncharacterized membrane protein YfcA